MAAMEILKTWLSAERGRAKRLAEHLNVVPSFVTKMADGEKAVPFQYGAAIEAFTGGKVSRRRMFPNDWERIWPELITADAKHPEAA